MTLRPSLGLRGAFRSGATIVLSLSLVLAGGCTAKFFKIDPDANGSGNDTKRADAPPAKPVPAKAPKPKPAERPKTAPPPAASVRPVPARPVPVSSAPLPSAPAPVTFPSFEEPAAAASDSAGVARLATLASVWQIVGSHHPATAGREDEWDGAVARAVVAVRAANTTDALREIYGVLTATMRDPLTRLEGDSASPVSANTSVQLATLADSTLVLSMPPSGVYRSDESATVARVVTANAARVVIDLRATVADHADNAGLAAAGLAANAFTNATALVPSLISTPLPMPRVRVRRTGSQGAIVIGASSTLIGTTGITGGWLERDAERIVPSGSRQSPPRIVVVVNGGSVVPQPIAALVFDRRASLVAEGRSSDESLVPSTVVAIAPGLMMRVRTGDVVNADGVAGFHADTVVAATATTAAAADSAPALQVALRWVRAPLRATSRTSLTQRPAFPEGSAAYANDTVPYPYMGSRVLAGYRIWQIMRAQHAHRDSYDDDIDAVFERTVPRLEAAQNRAQYATALRDFVASFDDSQVALHGASVDALQGPALAAFRARTVEGRTLVTWLGTGSTGVQLGTEIVAADGYPMPAWLLEHKRAVSASNEWTRARDLTSMLQRGPDGAAQYRLRDAAGLERSVTLPRALAPDYAGVSMRGDRTTPATARLAGDIAYIDLDRVDAAAAEEALDNASSSRALIVDLRGTARAWATVLRRLAVTPSFTVARVVQRARSIPCTVASLRDVERTCVDERTMTPAVVRIDTAGHYRGRVVVLIDERTQGPAEQLALALDVGARATMVGSTSAGAAADTVSSVLAGGLRISYPIDELRRADGGQLHRTGFTPLIEAHPTVRGVRAGKDETLDRALALLQASTTETRRRR